MGALLKFGGSSLKDYDLIKKACQKIISDKNKYKDIVVVVSAMGDTTNNLINDAKALAKYPNKRDLDSLLVVGELKSASLVSIHLNELGYKAIALNAYQAGIYSNGNYNNSNINHIDNRLIKEYLKDGYIVVVPGFQGINNLGEFMTLGRGGSDQTAIKLAASLNYEAIIYTDVDGIYGIDPRIYKDAKKIDKISYEEMKEMATLGAKVMENKSIDFAHHNLVDVIVKRMNGNGDGTLITSNDKINVRKKVTGIAVSNNIIMVSIRRIPFKSHITTTLFNDLAQNGVNVDIINQNPGAGGFMNIAFTANVSDIDLIDEVLDKFKNKYPRSVIIKDSEVFKVSLVGSQMREESGVAALVFKILDENNFEFRLVTTSEISISYTFDNKNQDKIIELLASYFNL
ncbi:MAG: aspartate kinase [Acholeplasmataceae bacterium]